jgi:hypothetical protein
MSLLLKEFSDRDLAPAALLPALFRVGISGKAGKDNQKCRSGRRG